MREHKQFFTRKSLVDLIGKYFSNVKIFGYRGDTKKLANNDLQNFGFFCTKPTHMYSNKNLIIESSRLFHKLYSHRILPVEGIVVMEARFHIFF
jgi:hypothetical protein